VCVLLAIIVGVSGCARNKDFSLWPFGHKKKQDNMGIMAPNEEITALKKMVEDSPKLSADERTRRANKLVKAIQVEKDPTIRAQIVRTLAAYPTEASTAVINAASRDPEMDVRLAVCPILGKRGDATAISQLSELLKTDTSMDVRLAAARALGETHDKAAVAALGEALEDRDPAMQYRAVQSLQAVTGQNFGNDVERWQHYVRGEAPKPREPTSIAERFRNMF
jgi:HEAT repeat protein